MTVAIAGLAVGNSGSADYATTSFNTASATPGANRLQLLAVAVDYDAAQASLPSCSVSGAGLTWVQVASYAYWPDAANFWNGIYLFRAMGASPSTGALTVTLGVNPYNWAYSWTEATGMDTGGTNGSAAIVQSATARATSTAIAATLAAFGSAANATYLCAGLGNDFGNAVTATVGTGFTELHDTYPAGGYAGAYSEWRADNDTSPDATSSNPAGIEYWGAVAVEIANAPAGGVLAGSANLATTITGVLSGAGALSGPSVLSLTPVGVLLGAGVLTGTTSLAFTLTSGIAGSGALTGSIPIILDANGNITGTGFLSGVAPLILDSTGAITGTGVLAGSTPLIFDITGTLINAGAGDMSGMANLQLAITGTLTGAGVLAGVLPLIFNVTGTITGSAQILNSSGEHRLANARSVDKNFYQEVKKKQYQSIDWSVPIFGEIPKPVIPVPVKVIEPEKQKPDYNKENIVLSDIDLEIKNLMHKIIAQEETVAKLEAIKMSIQSETTETERLEMLRKRRIALLLLLMTA